MSGIEYARTFGHPGERKIRTHIVADGMDMAMCGLDVVGDDLVHDAPPEMLPRGVKHRVTCEDCQQIIEAVKEHLKPGK